MAIAASALDAWGHRLEGRELLLAASGVDDLAQRIDALEARPFSALPEGQFDDAMRAVLAALRADLDAQRAEIRGLAAAAAEDLQSAQDAAAEVAAATAAAARNTLANSALAQIAAALDTGVAFEGPLAELEKALGIVAPAGLAAVAQDGGDITFHGFDRGVVYLHMKGACAGCPSSTLTLKMGIENLLRHYIPEVTEVRPVAA